uniref:Probable arginine--tRNA ligase, mitochondrial n=1 Tax=Parascaris equorum TaxID=6256 RepID=A0A914RLG1_PAREQ
LHSDKQANDTFERLSSTRRRRILIDYSSPNIAKRFHIGNLRSIFEVTSLNYLGDWGSQFALIVAYWPKMRPTDEVWNNCNDLEKIDLLTSCYVKANAVATDDVAFRAESRCIFKEMENDLIAGNLNNERLLFWDEVRKISVRHLDEFYRRLRIKFDVTSPESENVKKAHELIDGLLNKGIARLAADGIAIVKDDRIEGYAAIRKSDNSSLYLSRELASILGREERYAADSYMYVVDRAQSRHFELLKNLLSIIERDDLSAKIHHIPFGRVKGLSTRNGRTEAVDEIVDRGCELAADFIRKSKTIKIDESRLVSLEKRNEELMHELDAEKDSEVALELELGEETRRLVAHLWQFDEALFSSWQKMEPCRVTVYLLQALSRLLLFAAARGVLKEGMKLIGLEPLDQM